MAREHDYGVGVMPSKTFIRLRNAKRRHQVRHRIPNETLPKGVPRTSMKMRLVPNSPGVALLTALTATAAVACGNTRALTAGIPSEGTMLVVSSVENDDSRFFELRVQIRAPRPIRIYSWRGQIYPLIGSGLAVKATDPQGREVPLVPVEVFMPEVPHSADVVESASYEYSRSLRLKTKSGGSNPPCIMVSLVYDTTADIFRKPGLTPIQAESNLVRFCRP